MRVKKLLLLIALVSLSLFIYRMSLRSIEFRKRADWHGFRAQKIRRIFDTVQESRRSWFASQGDRRERTLEAPPGYPAPKGYRALVVVKHHNSLFSKYKRASLMP
jgi:poly(3-hydroxybutyrate) depolymerase